MYLKYRWNRTEVDAKEKATLSDAWVRILRHKVFTGKEDARENMRQGEEGRLIR